MFWSGRVLLQFQRIFSSNQGHFSNSLLDIAKMPYYAVARGRSVGIYQSWGDCEAQVKGFSGARYKKFDSSDAAQNFISTESATAPPQSKMYNNKPQYYAGPSKGTISNLKRNYSTTSDEDNNHQSDQSSRKYSKSRSKPGENEDSDDSDDLTEIIIKQMDDIEERVNKFGKGIDNIIKKNKVKGSGRKAILLEPPKAKRRRSQNRDFDEDSEGYVQVYTDGACSANGKKGARAGLGVFWGDGHALNTSEPVSGRATNNCGEIQAATHAIRQAVKNGITKLKINTDSQFLINAVTKWIPGWKRKGWRLASGEPVKNEIDFKDLDSLQNKLQIKWNYVEAHKGIHGNEMADQLARAGAAMYNRRD